MSARAAWRLESLGFGHVLRYTAGKRDWVAAGLPSEGEQKRQGRVLDVVRCDVPTCRLGDRIGAVRDRVRGAGWDICTVIAADRTVLGRLRTEAFAAAPATLVEALMAAGPSTFRPDVPLRQMLSYMDEHGIRSALITDQDGQLFGMLFLEDVERGLAEVGRPAAAA
jgi:hypothetical protein